MAAIALFLIGFPQWAHELQDWWWTNFLSLVEEYEMYLNKHIIWDQESTFEVNHQNTPAGHALVHTAEQSQSAQTGLLGNKIGICALVVCLLCSRH